ncbi:Response regulator MprA [Vibrio jasicida]|uniref:Response regulator MprA n=1 Tax=Vibrio jasicida TaxID=766224 RepID=A0AAU9QN26_9VIBR|nr:Response regulator MprA [Vibrio jasicida]CAH1593864.1 Response regulator MprA [Vibrio jasicida]
MDVMHKHLLLVDDNIELAKTIMEYLEMHGIHCDHASNGMMALKLARSDDYDLVILDVNLPQLSGLKVCEELRLDGIDLPILILSARSDLSDKLAGFQVGADDYMVKPFALEELLARVQVLLKRRSGAPERLVVGDLVLDISSREVFRGEDSLNLSPTCYNILKVMMSASPSPVSRSKIMRLVWGDASPESNSLKVHMFKLRQAVDKGQNIKLIHTLPNFGYVLKSKSRHQ